jgi:multidrug efflux pump subunit AcrA (membrane-fusion protein)
MATVELARHKVRQELKKYRDAIDALDAKIAARVEDLKTQQIYILDQQAKQASIQQDIANLRNQRSIDDAALTAAEEAAVYEINLELAGEIIKRQASDPVQHYQWIVDRIGKLRSSVRGGLDTPNNQKFSIHPLITQALSLIPPPSDMDRPVFELGAPTVAGVSDWRSRRKKILAEAERNPPPQAA